MSKDLKSIQTLSKKLITENIVVNLLGNVLPMLIAVITIPIVINNIGVEKFGILSIAWLFLGYFSILDLGIGRATTKFVIEYNNKGLTAEVGSLIWTSILSLFLFGILIGALLLLLTSYITNNFLNIPPYLKDEARSVFYMIAMSIPFVIGVAAAKGVLEAQHKFRLLNIIKIPASALNYLIPATVALFSRSLPLIIGLLASTRVLLLLVHLYFCFRPLTKKTINKFDVVLVKKLISYGGWLTVSNLVGPIMVYFDRFIIGSILTLTLLTYYSTPYEVITKLLVIAGSATSVLFPALTNFYLMDKAKFYDTYNKSLKGLLVLIFPITIFFASFSHDILTVWLGDKFANNSSVVLQLLSLGVLLNSIAAIPFTALQALNRPDITAKVHLAELPFYLASLWFFAHRFGISGVGMAWMLRNMVDAVVFMFIYNRVRHTPEKIWRGDLIKFLQFSTFILSCFIVSFLLSSFALLPYKIPSYILMVSIFLIAFWLKALNADERSIITKVLKK